MRLPVVPPSGRVLKHGGTKQQALERFLREEIARGRIKPGTRLKQQELARQFGMSPTPVRETLRRLEGDGLVLYAPNRGIRVAQVDGPEVEEIYLMRMALESLAVRSAATRLTAEDLSTLSHLQDRMDRATAQGRLKTLRTLNHDFHMAIYSRAGYHRLFQFIQALWGLFPWDTLQVIPGRAEGSMREHHAILSRLRNGHGPAAAGLMQAHISRSCAALRAHLAARPARRKSPR
jgi:DNA-binding GntR family transcriptional regulator